jgi:uncharacterized protein YuzE
MKIKYDKEVDVIYIRFSNEKITESDENNPGIILDYDAKGNIAGIELLHASSRLGQVNSVEYEFA